MPLDCDSRLAAAAAAAVDEARWMAALEGARTIGDDTSEPVRSKT